MSWRQFGLLFLIAAIHEVNCQVSCLRCEGFKGTDCDVDPSKETLFIPCTGSCVVWYSLFTNGRAIRTVYRGCASEIYPRTIPNQYRDSCKTDSSDFIECSNTCNTEKCNMQLSAFTDRWNPDGTPKNSSIQQHGTLLLAQLLLFVWAAVIL